jgi:hypothetical protein
MMSEWEIRRLAEIEWELSSDHALAQELAKLSPRRHCAATSWRRNYSTGYLLSALTYMFMSMAGNAARGLGGLMIAVLIIWIGEQVVQAKRGRRAGGSAVLAADD